MNRFFLPEERIQEQSVTFPDDIAHQIRHVLRMREGQVVQVLDNTGWVYEVVLVKVTNGEVMGQIREKYYGDTEPKLNLALFLSLTQRDKFEWALQKCTEVGVTSFIPVITSREDSSFWESSDHCGWIKNLPWRRDISDYSTLCQRDYAC